MTGHRLLHRIMIVLAGLMTAIVIPGTAIGQPIDTGPSGLDLLLVLMGILTLIAILLLPTIIAFHRGHPNRWVITLVNVFLGGTGIGWFGALIWSFSAVHRTKDPNGSHGGESGLNIFANDPVTLRIEPTPGLPSAFAPPPPLVAPNTPQTTPPSAPPAPDLIDRLERLKRLHDGGAIDADQFASMRDRLVAEAG